MTPKLEHIDTGSRLRHIATHQTLRVKTRRGGQISAMDVETGDRVWIMAGDLPCYKLLVPATPLETSK